MLIIIVFGVNEKEILLNVNVEEFSFLNLKDMLVDIYIMDFNFLCWI